MTTPDQLAKWREEFETNTKPHKLVRYSGGAYQLDYMEDTWTGYLRAKQENEQAMKLAKFGAMVAISYVNGDRFVPVHELDNLARIYSVVDSASVFTSDIKATIKELLND